MRYWLATTIAILALAPGAVALAQQDEPILRDREDLVKARVIEASPSETVTVEGTDIQTESQTLTIEVLEGPDKGTTVTFVNDFTQLTAGEYFYVRHAVHAMDGFEQWTVSDPYRLDVLLGVAIAFLILLLLFGGLQGIRGLVSLVGSFVLLFYLLVPGIYAGYSPILVSIAVASLIIIGGSYVTHGVNRTTTSAMLGMLATVVVTGAATYFVIHAAGISGFTSENNVYLNFATSGRIDMLGLLFGGIMIGLLGVLYDIAIGQAVAVEELYRANPASTRAQVYGRGLRIGREHIGALVNTLAIAYVGASLPLLLLFHEATVSVAYIVNSELFATEIIRILMGSIGLILAVPVTTGIAASLLKNARFTGGAASPHAHASHTPKNSSE